MIPETRIISLEEWDAASPEDRKLWARLKYRMKKSDQATIRRRQDAEDRRIAYDMSYEGSREFQEDIGS